MIAFDTAPKVYLAIGNTDMRKSIDGLSVLAAEHFSLDPFSGHLFAFSNRSRNIVKLLFWDKNGFWILHKRLEKGKFRWPKSESEVMELNQMELRWLIDGLDPLKQQGFDQLKYSTIY